MKLRKQVPSAKPTHTAKGTDQFTVVRFGSKKFHWGDLYHLLLRISWPGFLGIVIVAYLITNTCFALAYLAGGDGLTNAKPGSFPDAFFFSVQTMASIGYGAIYPKTFYTNLLVTIEALVGLIELAMTTGLIFARFSIPTARIMFSRVVVIAPFNGVPTLMFRAANQRHNQILEAQLRVSLVRDEVNLEGQWMRRIYDLPLVRNQTPIFGQTLTVMHPIDEHSPLHNATQSALGESDVAIVVILTGIDETVSQTVHARHIYSAQDILCNMAFVDLFFNLPDGRRAIDYRHFHDVRPL